MRSKRYAFLFMPLLSAGLLACNTSKTDSPRRPAAELSSIQPTTELGESWLWDDEAATRQVIDINTKMLVGRTGNSPLMKRDAHPKHHGCVKAVLSIDASGLPAQDQVGLFAHPATELKSWVRFSNGDPDSTKPDTDEDVRGMAVKIMGLTDDNFLSQAGTEPASGIHDLVMMNSPVFFIKNAPEYADFMTAVAGSSLALPWFMLGHPTTLMVLQKARGMNVGNPLHVDYFSATPYKLGADVMRFEMRSSVPAAQRDKKPSHAGPDFLRERLVASLGAGAASYDLLVQRATPSKEINIENPTESWDEKKFPYVKVGTLSIPQQTGIDSGPQMNFCENVSFNPWRALVPNRPLGAINRVRLDTYLDISKLRHEHNRVPQLQPTGFDVCSGATAALCGSP